MLTAGRLGECTLVTINAAGAIDVDFTVWTPALGIHSSGSMGSVSGASAFADAKMFTDGTTTTAYVFPLVVGAFSHLFFTLRAIPA